VLHQCQLHAQAEEATDAALAHLFTLFGGSRGPGKSYWLRWFLLAYVLHWSRELGMPVNAMLGCENYPSLKDRQIGKIAVEFPPELGQLRETKEKGLGFHLWPSVGGGSVLLRNLDDASKYQSAEFAAIGIDELSKNAERTFHILRGSLRWPGIERAPFVAATNPEANWVRDYWIEKRIPAELSHLAHEFCFVPGLPDDNPYLPPAYWEQLDSLPGALRQAWRYGDWYAAVEGLVFENFTAENVTDEEPDPARPFEIAIDDGYIDPRATLFIQRQPSRVLVFDELYQTKKLEEETIRDILVCCYQLALRQGQEAAWPEDGQEGEEAMSIEAIVRGLAAQGVALPELAAVSHEAVALRRRLQGANIPARNWLVRRAGGGPSTRVEAIKLTRSLICDGKGYRALQVHRRCANLLDEMRMGYKYPEGRHGLEEKPEEGNDHACDALTGWCWLRVGP
jgi:hypothetical protein